MILLAAPDDEGLVLVEVDAPALGPEARRVCSLEEPVALLEEVVGVNQVLLHCLVHGLKGVVLT